MKNTATTNANIAKLNDLKKLAMKKEDTKMVKGGVIVVGDWRDF